ncbi:hypothetical protein LCGC14_3078120, partial [marine sediment metagenome]
LHDPTTGLPLPIHEVVRLGKIDHLIEWQNMIGPIERKSTVRDISPEGDFWQRSRKDTQVSMYALAINDMSKAGLLPGSVTVGEDQTLGNTLYDVWRRPTTKPKAITQKDTKLFVEDGMYFDEKFEVTVQNEYKDDEGFYQAIVQIDGVDAEVVPGKKGFAVKETVAMYCSRLLADIYERPEHYFQRREIARTEKELTKFRKEIWNIYQTQKSMDRTKSYYENENQCKASYWCPYIPICYGPGADEVCKSGETPSGFKRIFVNLTNEQQPINEGE